MNELRNTADALRRRMGVPVRPAWTARVFIALDVALGRSGWLHAARAWGSPQPALCRVRATRPTVGRVR